VGTLVSIVSDVSVLKNLPIQDRVVTLSPSIRSGWQEGLIGLPFWGTGMPALLPYLQDFTLITL